MIHCIGMGAGVKSPSGHPSHYRREIMAKPEKSAKKPRTRLPADSSAGAASPDSSVEDQSSHGATDESTARGRRFSESGHVEEAGRGASPDSDGEARTLEDVEKIGRSHAERN